MPLDFTRYDEATLQLEIAKRVLIEGGWCVGQRFMMTGERCALGALDVAIGEMANAGHLAVARLADAIPPEARQRAFGPDYEVALFNNSQGGVNSILMWFDRAIAPV